MLYWFEEENILCDKYGEEYSVINGGWRFKIRNGNSVLSSGEIIHRGISEPLKLTREEFDERHPEFGY
ncbi:hypothetical protein [Brumicola nitratireducens]|uniref:Uncharacterized protein n=1 Tax=Glaciecola nitratireducens (strain JCM 12485 / KCTC 12276 / FR1064) TaxID=1085623 RepID=G4QGY0_GLANF|nr:hypothetical protein [Glaciecola nitratireducens]AEP29925.1 hypothetical protein GNIT_1815 [Glaciecola nitratireducens FR1064]